MSIRAHGEASALVALDEIICWTESAEIIVSAHTFEGRETPIVAGWDEILEEIGDKHAALVSLKESTFFHPYSGTGAKYESLLVELDGNLQRLKSIQPKWIYLESYFILGTCPVERLRFDDVDFSFRSFMIKTKADPRILHFADNDIKSLLARLIEDLDICHKALKVFLENKRFVLPRLYFLGDENLMQILAPHAPFQMKQVHLKSLFQAIYSVTLDSDDTEIVCIRSEEGETVPLQQVRSAPLKHEIGSFFPETRKP